MSKIINNDTKKILDSIDKNRKPVTVLYNYSVCQSMDTVSGTPPNLMVYSIVNDLQASEKNVTFIQADIHEFSKYSEPFVVILFNDEIIQQHICPSGDVDILHSIGEAHRRNGA